VPIFSAAPRIVVFSGRQSSYGRVIKIAHPNGLTTIYAHNSANFVKVGDRVKGGALIGAVGSTGHATTNHLHFEVRRHGMAYDPLTLLPSPEPASQDRSRVVETTPRRH
jgi:murein DD-endopeptidase MepM/ murein hydrolase activator NlpD